jgi:hypothetical protein
MIHPNKHLTGWQGILQSDVYGGYNDLYLSESDLKRTKRFQFLARWRVTRRM